MYCIKCGVELADSEQKCALCGTRVYHPDIERELTEPLYPDVPYEVRHTVTHAGGLFIVTFIFALGILLPFICDLSVNGGVRWSVLSMTAVLLAYILLILPIWFKRPNPVVFVPCDMAACALYLLVIERYTHGHWFLPFALPTVGCTAVIATAVVALCRYVRRGYLYIFGGAMILGGGTMLLMEFLLNKTFGLHEKLVWSIYPFAACAIIGILLIIIAICPGLRTTLQKKFFV